jgi:hypothetical protein
VVWVMAGFVEERAADVDVRKPEELVWPWAIQAQVQVPIDRQSYPVAHGHAADVLVQADGGADVV